MDTRAWARSLLVVLGLALAGAALGFPGLARGWFRGEGIVLVLAVPALVAPLLAVQVYRHHGQALAAVVAGAAGAALALAAFFAAPLLAYGLREGFEGVHWPGVLLVAGLLPLLMGGAAGAGTAVLVRGVRRHRARHGLAHAPRRA